MTEIRAQLFVVGILIVVVCLMLLLLLLLLPLPCLLTALPLMQLLVVVV
jgi:hypothetical protein